MTVDVSHEVSLPLADAMSTLLTTRFSCRAFLPQPVPRETLQQAFALAQRTGSWCNSQAWQVSLVSGAPLEALRTQMQAAAANEPAASDLPFPATYEGVYQARRRECGLQLYEAVGVARGDREASARQAMENFRFFGAPHLAILSAPVGLGVYGAVDVGGYVQVLLLALAAHGVASIAQAAPARHSDLLRAHVPVAEGEPARQIVCAVSLGYCDEQHPANQFRTTRAPVDSVLTWVG